MADESAPPPPKGLLFTIEPWKAALLGPYVDFTGLGTILPLLPFWCRDAGVDEVWVGLILSAQYAALVVGSLFWGRLADRIGVRNAYIILLVLDVVFFFLSAIMDNIVGLLICRAAAGFCAIMPLGTAWITMATPPEKQMKAFSMLVVMILLGFISGSIIGGTLAQVKSGVGVGDGGWFSAVGFSALLVLIVLFVIVFGTAKPPAPAAGQEAPKPEGVKDAVMNLPFAASCITGFLGANEGGVLMVCMSAVLTNPRPRGYAYEESFMGIAFMGIASVLLISSLFFGPWLGDRTHPYQRVCFLGLCCMSVLSLQCFLTISLEAAGLWPGGDMVFLGSVIGLFWFQCCVAPTAMAIAGMISQTKAKNATGTVMGIQQMIMNSGQAVGPTIGAVLQQVNMYLPFVYLVVSEFAVWCVNMKVFNDARKTGEIDRPLFKLQKNAPPPAPEAENESPDEKSLAPLKDDPAPVKEPSEVPSAPQEWTSPMPSKGQSTRVSL